jgi:sterol carrier protein 2
LAVERNRWKKTSKFELKKVPNLKYALQHNLGLGGACVMALYKKYNSKKSTGTSDLK